MHTPAVVVDYLDDIDLVKRPAKTQFSGLSAGAYLTARSTRPSANERRRRLSILGRRKWRSGPEEADVHSADGTLLHKGVVPFQAFQLSRQEAGRIAVPSTDVTVNL